MYKLMDKVSFVAWDKFSEDKNCSCCNTSYSIEKEDIYIVITDERKTENICKNCMVSFQKAEENKI